MVDHSSQICNIQFTSFKKSFRRINIFFCLYIQNFYLAFCSLRNSGRKKGKMLVVSEYFFSRYKPSQLDFSNCDSEKRILNFEFSFMLITHRYNEETWQLNIDCSLAKRKGRKKQKNKKEDEISALQGGFEFCKARSQLFC